METLNEGEIQAILRAVMRSGPATEDELWRVVRWAHKVRVNHIILEMILEGGAFPRWPDGARDLQVHAA